MKTIPNATMDEHIQYLENRLKSFFPDVSRERFLYYDYNDLLGSKKNIIHKNKLMDENAFYIFFNKLCSEGREWINLSSDSWYGDNFMISVESSMRLDYPVTSILFSGPTLGLDHKPLKKTRLTIIE